MGKKKNVEVVCETEFELFSELPLDMKRLVFTFIEPRDLRAASCVCKEWNNIAHHKSLDFIREKEKHDLNLMSIVNAVASNRLDKFTILQTMILYVAMFCLCNLPVSISGVIVASRHMHDDEECPTFAIWVIVYCALSMCSIFIVFLIPLVNSDSKLVQKLPHIADAIMKMMSLGWLIYGTILYSTNNVTECGSLWDMMVVLQILGYVTVCNSCRSFKQQNGRSGNPTLPSASWVPNATRNTTPRPTQSTNQNTNNNRSAVASYVSR